MSVQAMSWAYDQRVGDPSDKAVLLSLANHAGRDGTNAYPGQHAVAEETELPIRSVERSIANLVKNGWISQTRRQAPGRPRTFALAMQTAANMAANGTETNGHHLPDSRQLPAKQPPSSSGNKTGTLEPKTYTPTPNGVGANQAVKAFAQTWQETHDCKPISTLKDRAGKMAERALHEGKSIEIVSEAARECARRRTFSAWALIIGDLEAGEKPGRRPAPWANQARPASEIFAELDARGGP